MHGLHDMFYFERKKHSCSIFTIFFHGYLSTAMFILFLSRFVAKCVILDVAGVIKSPPYTPTWTAYTTKLIQVSEER